MDCCWQTARILPRHPLHDHQPPGYPRFTAASISLCGIPTWTVAKEHIWRHFTKLGGAGDGFPAETYEQLARRLPPNGRQIRSTIKIASLVAARLKVPPAVERVWTALQATQGSDGAGVSA